MNEYRNPVGWFEIYVQDMERAREFYEKVFEAELTRLETPGIELWAFPMDQEKPGSCGALVKMEGKDPGVGGTIIYFSCIDCAEEEARVEPNGGKVHMSKMSIGEYGFISLVLDTEGNMIGLHSRR